MKVKTETETADISMTDHHSVLRHCWYGDKSTATDTTSPKSLQLGASTQ